MGNRLSNGERGACSDKEYVLDICIYVFVYLCICVFVFVYLCMRHLEISVLISLDQELSENVWFIWSKTSYSGDVTMRDGRTTNDERRTTTNKGR